MGVKVREKPPGSGIFWVFINHNSRRKSKKIGMDEDLANELDQVHPNAPYAHPANVE